MKVSVIIPCYNQGNFIDETVDSVLNQTFQDYEIIIVNDGSTDEFTNRKLSNYNRPKTKVISTTNQGLAAARNNGIQASCGEYILPLDSDDLIRENYLEKAVQILDNNPKVGIVYSDTELFENEKGIKNMPEFSLENILKRNIMSCSAFFRKSDFSRTSGYDVNMKYGLEDWDFWLSLLELNILVVKIQEPLFLYRIRSNSMARSISANQKDEMFKYVYMKHHNLYNILFSNPIAVYNELDSIKKSWKYKTVKALANPFKSVAKIFR